MSERYDGWHPPELDKFDPDGGYWVWTICRWEGGHIVDMVNVETNCEERKDAKADEETHDLARGIYEYLASRGAPAEPGERRNDDGQ